MRKLLLATTTALALSFSAPAHSQQAVLCVNCSTIAQQLLGYARQLYQLQQEIQTAQNTLQFYLNAVQNTANLPGTVYRDITSDVQQIESIANSANMLSGNTGIMLGNLGSVTGYPLAATQNWQQRLIAENNTIARAMTAAANVLQQQQAALQTNAATLNSLQSQALGTNGRQATLQTLAGIEATIGQQIQSQQGTLAAAVQAMMTYQTARADRQAITDAAEQQDLQRAQQATCQALAAGGGSSNACGSLYAGGAPTTALTTAYPATSYTATTATAPTNTTVLYTGQGNLQ